MYERYYGLRDRPFELTPNPKYLYLTPSHREALSTVQYGLAAAKAVTVLIGEAGTGKTTLLETALDSPACRYVRALHLKNPRLTRQEFIQTLAQGFGLTAAAAASKAELLTQLEQLIRERRARGVITALIVDEAQGLDIDLLEEIRLLGNIETASEKLLPLVLVGQPALATRLEDAHLSQLKQRVALRCEVRPFCADETAGYIFTRIAAAGGSATTLFTLDAVAQIHKDARGIPRTISVMCDNALMTGYALRRRPIDREIVSEVARDFWLRRGRRDLSGTQPLPSTAAPAGPGRESAAEPGARTVDEPGTPTFVPKRLFARLTGDRPSSAPSPLRRVADIKRR